MMLGKGFGRKWPWPVQCTLSAFAWMSEGSCEETSVRIANALAENQTKNIPVQV
jgi:hypothetical protein